MLKKMSCARSSRRSTSTSALVGGLGRGSADDARGQGEGDHDVDRAPVLGFGELELGDLLADPSCTSGSDELLDACLELEEEVNDGVNRYVEDTDLQAFFDQTSFIPAFLFLVN